jgi:hypothetical protein
MDWRIMRILWKQWLHNIRLESKQNKEHEAMLKKSYQQVKEGKTVKRAVKHLT